MKPLKITARYARKINLGDYESVEAELMIISEVEEVDGACEDVESVAELTHQQCKAAVWKALEQDIKDCQVQRYLPKVTHKFQGKIVAPPSEGKVVKTDRPDDFGEYDYTNDPDQVPF